MIIDKSQDKRQKRVILSNLQSNFLMDCTNYIINDHQPFDLGDHLTQVRDTLSHSTLSHVLVTQNENYLGALSETDALCFDQKMPLSEVQYALTPFFVSVQNSWFEILQAFAQHQTNIMPVLDEHGKYLGYYELNDVMHIFHSTPFLSAEGIVLVVGHASTDFSVAELTQILESNGGKLYGLFVSGHNEDTTEITLKVSTQTISICLEALRRYGYAVYSIHEKDSTLNQLKERSEYLDKYLNI